MQPGLVQLRGTDRTAAGPEALTVAVRSSPKGALLVALAWAVRAAQPAAEILFLTASEASHLIYREGFAAIKVPSRTAAATGRLRRDSLLRVTQAVAWNTMLAFDPHALVVDTFPAGT